ncbi:site-specific integrase [Micromonospora kangleipakensis]|uniref:site-specific integrase n=1 Tax=Micromonospora kangleipakensis TaxID=1077942 RepID=UPI001F5F6DDB|nr:site-specific integrase [Micromonospora kangleipakensis]
MTIAALATLVAIAATASVFLLLSLVQGVGNQAEEVRLQIEAIKTGLTVGAGTGGALALLLAARKQWLSEREHLLQIRVSQVGERDAEERRVTDLYAKAAELLGHERPSARIAALYALSRLGETNPAHRDTVINLICGYLRLAPPIDPADASPWSFRDELEVRYTAQRILKTHLTGSDVAERWEPVELDLTQATLYDFDLEGHGRGKRWRVRYVDDTGQPKQKLFERRADADQFDVNTRADVSRGQYVDPVAGKASVTAYGEQWREHQLHRDATVARIEMTLRVHVEPILGRMQLAQVRPSHIQAWVKDRAKVLAPSSLRVVYHVLVGMFDAATRDRMIGRSPCVGIRLPEIERVERFIPTPDQVHALADTFSVKPEPGKPSRERYRALVYLAAGAGLRQGEAWGLELEHVDFLRREIRIVQQLVTPPRKTPRLAPTKTATSRRTVEMGQVA